MGQDGVDHGTIGGDELHDVRAGVGVDPKLVVGLLEGTLLADDFADELLRPLDRLVVRVGVVLSGRGIGGGGL